MNTTEKRRVARAIAKRRKAVATAATREGYRPVADLAARFGVSEKTIRQDRRVMGLTHSPVRTAKRRSMMVTQVLFGEWSTRDLMRHYGLARKTVEKDKRIMRLV